MTKDNEEEETVVTVTTTELGLDILTGTGQSDSLVLTQQRLGTLERSTLRGGSSMMSKPQGGRGYTLKGAELLTAESWNVIFGVCVWGGEVVSCLW